MKKNAGNFYLSIFLTLTISAIAKPDVECKGGGDSGTPFIDISKEFKLNAKLLKTPGLIKDFLVRENKQELVYRSEDNTVWKANSSGFQPISYMQNAFSRILDPWNDFILAKNSPWALSTSNHSWYRVGSNEKRGQDLYWSGTRVFTLEKPDYAKQTISYSIHNLNGYSQKLACSLSFGSGVEMHIGTSGHTYPYLFLYTTEVLSEGTKVAKFALRLEAKKKLLGQIPRCELTSLGEYKKLMPGIVKGLYHFGNLDNTDNSAWLMDIEHPKKRFLWSYQEQCTYFSAPSLPVIIPNPQVPVIAMQKKEGGITLLYPWVEKSADIMEKLVKHPLTSEQLWLTRDRKNLYVAAQPENENARMLFKVALDQVQ